MGLCATSTDAPSPARAATSRPAPKYIPSGMGDVIPTPASAARDHPVVALQHHADKCRRRGAAGCTKLFRNHFVACGVKLGKGRSRKAREMIERLGNLRGIAAKGCEDVGLNGRVIRAGHSMFCALRNHHGGDDAQVAALPGRKDTFRGHVLSQFLPQSKRSASRRFIWSAT